MKNTKIKHCVKNIFALCVYVFQRINSNENECVFYSQKDQTNASGCWKLIFIFISSIIAFEKKKRKQSGKKSGKNERQQRLNEVDSGWEGEKEIEVRAEKETHGERQNK